MRRSIAALLVLTFALAVILTGCSGDSSDAVDPNAEKAPVTFIQFYDPECPFCQEMEPIVERMRTEYEPRIDSFEIINVTTTDGKHKVEEFGVFLTPTFVLLDANGDELDRINGAAKEEMMIEFMDRGIADATGNGTGGAREPIQGEGREIGE